MGPTVEEFEEAFAALCTCRHAIAVSNGTAALHLALLAVGCRPGQEVIVPSLNSSRLRTRSAIQALGPSSVTSSGQPT